MDDNAISKEFNKKIERIMQKDLGDFGDDCPSNFIASICQEFKFPQSEILSIK